MGERSIDQRGFKRPIQPPGRLGKDAHGHDELQLPSETFEFGA